MAAPTITKNFSAVGVSATITIPSGRYLSYAVRGTWVGTLRVVQVVGTTATPILPDITANVQTSTAIAGPGTFRIDCVAYTSGTPIATLAQVVATVAEWRDAGSSPLFAVDDLGLNIAGNRYVPGLTARRLKRSNKQVGILGVMAVPPTIGYGTANAASTLTGNSNAANVYTYSCLTGGGTANAVPNTTGPFRFSGFPIKASGTTSPNWNYLQADGSFITNATSEPTYVIEFDHYGDAFEFGVKGLTGCNFQMFVDDQPIALTTLIPGTSNIPNTGSNYLIKVTQAAVGHYRIRLECGIVCRVGGFNCASGQDICYPSTPAAATRALVLGDSYSAPGGTGMQSGPAAWVFELGRICGWNIIQSAVGGTGYLNNGGTHTTFRGRVENDVIGMSPAPDVVVVQGGYNDRTSSVAAIQDEATLLYNEILRGIPGVTLYVVGIQNPGAPDSTALAIEAGLLATCNSLGIPYISCVNAFARATQLIGADNVHPTDEGQRHFGRWIGGRIQQLLDV